MVDTPPQHLRENHLREHQLSFNVKNIKVTVWRQQNIDRINEFSNWSRSDCLIVEYDQRHSCFTLSFGDNPYLFSSNIIWFN